RPRSWSCAWRARPLPSSSWCALRPWSTRKSRVEPAFRIERIARHREGEHEVDDAREGKTGKQRHRGCPVRIGEGCPQLAEQTEDRDDQHQRSVLEQADDDAHNARDDVFESLRHDDETHPPPVAKA